MEAVVHQSRRAAIGFFIALSADIAVAIPLLLGYQSRGVILLTLCILPIATIAALVFSIALLRKGPGSTSVPLLIGGSLFITGGVAFDILATIIHTPDLSQEANPVARLLLDSDFSVFSVYAFGGSMQFLLVLIMCILWAAFLRHRVVIVQTSFRGEPDSFARFLKAATGGGELTWRQWLFPFTFRELPSAYYYVWITAPSVIALAPDRWYLGLKWFSLVPYGYRVHLLIAAFSIALSIYFLWLYREFQACIRGVQQLAEDEMADAASE